MGRGSGGALGRAVLSHIKERVRLTPRRTGKPGEVPRGLLPNKVLGVYGPNAIERRGLTQMSRR